MGLSSTDFIKILPPSNKVLRVTWKEGNEQQPQNGQPIRGRQRDTLPRYVFNGYRDKDIWSEGTKITSVL